MISGPRNQPQPPTQPVTRPPSNADKWANIAHCRSSALGTPVEDDVAEGGGVTDSGGTLISTPLTFAVGKRGIDSPPLQSGCQAPACSNSGHFLPEAIPPCRRRDVRVQPALPGRSNAAESLARHGHLADQDRAGEDGRARIHVGADRADIREHLAQIAGDGDLL